MLCLSHPSHNVPLLFQKATQISSVPLPDDDSGSEDDSSSLASLHTSTLVLDKKGSTPGSPRAVKRGEEICKIIHSWAFKKVCKNFKTLKDPGSSLGHVFCPAGVSMSSISSESDYAIPPDAYSLDSDCSEPEHKVQRTSSYSCESVGPVCFWAPHYLSSNLYYHPKI